MNEPALLVDRDGHIVTLTMNRTQFKNAMNPEMICRLADAWEMVNADDDVRVVILTGAGGIFSAGNAGTLHRGKLFRSITSEERNTFEQTLAVQRTQACDDLGVAADGDLSAADQARVDRLALSRTLEQLGYLTKTRVKRPPKKRKRKSRESL